MTISQALRSAARVLVPSSESPHMDAEILLSHVLRRPRGSLLAEGSDILAPYAYRKFRTLIARRRTGVPVAYLVGRKSFYGLEFEVTPAVLVPRPETEWLVEAVLEEAKNSKQIPKNSCSRILDVGTGSGCIIVSAAVALGRRAACEACDISLPALAVARRNARLHRADVRFFSSDLMKSAHGKFHIITANLPYVLPAVAASSGLAFEPRIALTDGTQTWELLQKFLTQLPPFLHRGGKAFLEIDPDGKTALSRLFAKNSELKHKFSRDLHGLWRYLSVTRV